MTKQKKTIDMAHTIDFEEAKVYVGTYAKYNNGSIFGKWLEISDYSDKDEFYEACAKLHADEHDPEYMFQDWENIPEGMISECSISNQVFELWQYLKPLSTSEREAFFIWFENDHSNFDKEEVEELVDEFKDNYRGAYESEKDFAEEYARETQELSDFGWQYFDSKSYANDLFIDSFWFSDGHVFDR